MVVIAPTIKLNNGKEFPQMGLGTWNSPKGAVKEAVKDAIDVGYRHIDCAHVYENEHEVGEGVNAKIAEGVVKREDLFITSKLWNCFHDPKDVRGACEYTLKQLNLGYLDLYLIHWPIGYQKSEQSFPVDTDGKPLHTNFDLLDTWREMEKLVDAGLAKSIGVSNFTVEQIDKIVANARIQPVTNQIEVHPYCLNKKLIKHCREKGVHITAYSPLGSPGRPWATAEDRVVLKEPKIIAIAEKYKKTPGQILIRYQIDVGNIPIPKSVTKERIADNFNVFDFKLSEKEIEEIENLGYFERVCKLSQDVDHPEYPFKED